MKLKRFKIVLFKKENIIFMICIYKSAYFPLDVVEEIGNGNLVTLFLGNFIIQLWTFPSWNKMENATEQKWNNVFFAQFCYLYFLFFVVYNTTFRQYVFLFCFFFADELLASAYEDANTAFSFFFNSFIQFFFSTQRLFAVSAEVFMGLSWCSMF